MGNTNTSKLKDITTDTEKKLLKIIDKTYFSRAEGRELYKTFLATCYPNEVLTKETFDQAFPQFAKENEIQKSIFDAMDANNGGSICFNEYIVALSKISRGTVDERADFALKILDLDGDMMITQSEVTKVCLKIAKVCAKSGIRFSETVPATVNKIFNNDTDEVTLVNNYKAYLQLMKESGQTFWEKLKEGNLTSTGLTYTEFRKRAHTDPDFLSCFGLFTIFYETIVKPIEEKIHKEQVKFVNGKPYMEGYLYCKNWAYDKRWAVLQNGFLSFYENRAHAILEEEEWKKQNIAQPKVDWSEDEKILKELRENESKHITLRYCGVSIENHTQLVLGDPKVHCSSGVVIIQPKEKIKPKEYSISAFRKKRTGLAGTCGVMSYSIIGTGKRLYVMWQIPYDRNFYNEIFDFDIRDDTVKTDESLYDSMRVNAEKDDEQEKIVSGFHIIGSMTINTDKLSRKGAVRIKLYHTERVSPPSMVLVLQEANVFRKHGTEDTFVFRNYQTHREFYVDDPSQLDKWVYAIQQNSNSSYEYGSFSPIRKNIGCQYFIGGGQYFHELAKCLKSAQHEIMITGWFLTPQLYLTRTKDGKFGDRLDEILLERAEHGVQVYILLWDEINAAFFLGSQAAQKYFNSLHRNIHLQRDPIGLMEVWSHHQKTVCIDQDIAFCGGIDIAYNRYEDVTSYPLTDWPDGRSQFPGRDYVNPMLGSDYVGDPLESVRKRHKEPRMPWQDIQVKVVGGVARDIARNFIQRWNKSKKQKLPFIALKSLPDPKNNEKYPACTVQCLRSASYWSVGLKTVEASIYKAQLDAINNAKYFIYIENQFFVSATSDSQSNPQNKIAQALVNKIRMAIQYNLPFKVILLTPIHSSSPMTGTSVQILTYWQYSCMLRGNRSIYGVLQKEFPNVDISKYFCITSLRNYGVAQDGLHLTEMVYVHSKLMIVDDQIAFISSANVNDRSMLGDRDSEIGVKIEDTEFYDTKLAGKPWKAGKFVYDLRMDLFRNFLGLAKDKSQDALIADPVAAYDLWTKTASDNTNIYVQVFPKIEDTMLRTDEVYHLTQYSRTAKPNNVELLKQVKGYVVEFPKAFLRESYKDPISQPTAVNKFFV